MMNMNYNDDDGSITVKFDTAKEMYDILTDISYADDWGVELTELQDFAKDRMEFPKKDKLKNAISDILDPEYGINLDCYPGGHCILQYGTCNAIRIDKRPDRSPTLTRMVVSITDLINDDQLGRIIILMNMYLDDKL